MADIAEAKQILQMDDGGTNLYDHLASVLLKVITTKDGSAVTNFESLSVATKAEKVSLPPPAFVPDSASGPVLTWATSSSSLFTKPDEDTSSGVAAPNLLADSVLYSWAGVSFGQGETYRLNLSLKKHAETVDAGYEAIKFWGKVVTRSGDFYVCYGKTLEEPEADSNTEGKDGANKYTYFVTKSISDASSWVALPNVTAAQNVCARQIRRLFTGDLSAAVPSYPPFPGVEENLLRATIGLITSDCAIAPAGTFEADVEGAVEPVKNDDGEVDPPGRECGELSEGGAWAHYESRINALGRCTKLPEPEDAGDDYEPPEGDDVAGPLGGVGEEEGKDNWSFRAAEGGAGQTGGSYAKGVSLDWPGAFAVAGGKTFVNVYVGDGLPYSATTYTPPLPLGISQEFGAVVEEGEESEAGKFPLEGKDVTADPTPPEEAEEE